MAPADDAQAQAEQMAQNDAAQQEIRKKVIKQHHAVESKNTAFNLAKIQESWLKIMRSAKTKQLKHDVEVIAQNHERDVDRKDATLQMLDRDLDEAEEQHQVSVRSHLLNLDKLREIQKMRLNALAAEFKGYFFSFCFFV